MPYVMVFGHEDGTASYLVTTDPVNASTSVKVAAQEDDNPVTSMWASVNTLRASEIYDYIRYHVRNGGDLMKVIMYAVEQTRLDGFDKVTKIGATTFQFELNGSTAKVFY